MHLFKKQTRKNWIKWAHKRISSSGVMLEDEKGRLLVVKATYKPYWTVPGGLIDTGETPKRTAVREVFEEVGIRLKEDDLTFVLVADRIGKEIQTYQFLFKAKLTNDMKDHIVLQSSEIEEHAFINKTQAQLPGRMYAKAVKQWANGTTGYAEQTFDK